MMSRTLTLCKQDIRFQFSNNFQLIYLVFVLMYSAILSFLPYNIKAAVLPILIFSEPGALSFIFTGAIIIYEKERGILDSLFTSPILFREYALSKIMSIGLLAMTGTAILTINSGVAVSASVYISVFISNAFCTALAFILAIGFKDILKYMILGGMSLSILFLPILEIYGMLQWPILRAIPSYSLYQLIFKSCFKGETPAILFYTPFIDQEWWLHLLITVAWLIPLYLFAGKRMKKYLQGGR